MPTISINHASIYYELHGKGDPLALIAGYTCDHTFWAPVLEQLANRYQVLIFDNRGVGQTKDDGSPITMQLFANDVLLLLEKLQLKRPHLVGHSMGGQIAQIVAGATPLNKLAILNSSATCRLAPLKAFQAFLEMQRQETPFDLFFQASVPWFYGRAFLSDDQKLQRLKEEFLSDPDPQSIADQERQLKALVSFDGKELCKSIDAPTLITYGSEDVVFLPDEATKLASLIRHSKLERIDCGHAAIPEIPDTIASLLLDFFE